MVDNEITCVKHNDRFIIHAGVKGTGDYTIKIVARAIEDGQYC